jgi:hypothetical protein
MDLRFLYIFLVIFINYSIYAEQTLYEYYTSGGIRSGLKADSEHFTLNGKEITIFSGSLHYFRVPHQYWKDRLMKFKAAGLNAVSKQKKFRMPGLQVWLDSRLDLLKKIPGLGLYKIFGPKNFI